MSSLKPLGKKLRLAKAGKQTRWAPVWIIPKINAGLKRVHPSQYTTKKRNWRKTNTKA
jgi:large subunit ribosomal protein L39e